MYFISSYVYFKIVLFNIKLNSNWFKTMQIEQCILKTTLTQFTVFFLAKFKVYSNLRYSTCVFKFHYKIGWHISNLEEMVFAKWVHWPLLESQLNTNNIYRFHLSFLSRFCFCNFVKELFYCMGVVVKCFLSSHSF